MLPLIPGVCDGAAPTAAGQAVIDAGSTLDCADSSDPVYRAVGVGSNGFQATHPHSRTFTPEIRSQPMLR